MCYSAFTGGGGAEVSRCQAVVDALAQQLAPHVSLDHIRGSHLADRDTLTINNLLDIFSGDLLMPSYQIAVSSSSPFSSSSLFCPRYLLLSTLPPSSKLILIFLFLLSSSSSPPPPLSLPPASSSPCFSVLFHLPVTSMEGSPQQTPQSEEKDSNISNILSSRGHFYSLLLFSHVLVSELSFL